MNVREADTWDELFDRLENAEVTLGRVQRILDDWDQEGPWGMSDAMCIGSLWRVMNDYES